MLRAVRRLPILLALAAPVVIAQCSSDGGSRVALAPTTSLGVTYGTQPSVSSTMVCQADGQTALSAVLKVATLAVTAPTWVDHLYGCTYEYPDGSFALSVKELPTIPTTLDYFNSLKAASTVIQPVALGDDGFMTDEETSIVRKDNKVLVVDVTKLPAQFGEPPRSRSDTSLTIAIALLGCWTGA